MFSALMSIPCTWPAAALKESRVAFASRFAGGLAACSGASTARPLRSSNALI